MGYQLLAISVIYGIIKNVQVWKIRYLNAIQMQQYKYKGYASNMDVGSQIYRLHCSIVVSLPLMQVWNWTRICCMWGLSL